MPPPKNKIPILLSAFGLEIVSPSENFKHWLIHRFPFWKFIDEYTDAMPYKWSLVERSDFLICYLAAESNVMSIAEESVPSTLIPIGASMDGGFFVLDTEDREKMTIGKIDPEQVLGDSRDKLGREGFQSFAIDYPTWLESIYQNPAGSVFT